MRDDARRTPRHGRGMHDCRWMNWWWSRGRLPLDGPELARALRAISHRRVL